MKNPSQEMIKARCETIGTVLRLLFWGYAIFVVVLLGLEIWMLFQPEGQFTLFLADTGNGIAGYGYFNGGFEVDFARNALRENAAESAKWLYLQRSALGLVERGLTLGILWNIRNIFRRIDREGTPFLQRNSRSIFWIGVLLMLSDWVGGGFWKGLLFGSTIIALSSIFEYGVVLQRESDETL